MKHHTITSEKPALKDAVFLNRRRFIQNMAAAGAVISLPSVVYGANPPKPSRHPRPDVVAIYCPLWHRYEHMDSWRGYGWTEWELLKNAPPRFPGHYQPLRPSWGCFDESDPKWSAREIDLAADHHIDVFLFDWYWYSGVKLMEEALEKGFLKSPNRKRLKFALMWAKPWQDFRRAVAAGQPEAAAKAMKQIRLVVMINMPLGLFTAAIGATGGFWAY